MANKKAMADRPTASETFLRAIEQVAQAFNKARKQGVDESSIQAIKAVREKQAEHEERRRRISEKIANGARLSRNS